MFQDLVLVELEMVVVVEGQEENVIHGDNPPVFIMCAGLVVQIWVPHFRDVCVQENSLYAVERSIGSRRPKGTTRVLQCFEKLPPPLRIGDATEALPTSECTVLAWMVQ